MGRMKDLLLELQAPTQKELEALETLEALESTEDTEEVSSSDNPLS